MLLYLLLPIYAAARGRTCIFTLDIVSTLIKTGHATIDYRSQHKINPLPTRVVSGKANIGRRLPRRYQVDPRSRRREVSRGVLRSSLKPENMSFFLPPGRDSEIWTSVLYTPVNKYVWVRRMVGTRHISPITGRVRTTVIRRWIGTPNERTSFRINDAVVGFVGRFLFVVSSLRISRLA